MQIFSRITEVKWGIICTPPNNQSCESVQPSVICVWMSSWFHTLTRLFTLSHNTTVELSIWTAPTTEHSRLMWRVKWHMTHTSVYYCKNTWYTTNISRKSSLSLLMFVKNQASNALYNESRTCISVFKLIKSVKRLQYKHMTLNSALYYQSTGSYNNINQYQVRRYIQINSFHVICIT